jgi:hypothetical protein
MLKDTKKESAGAYAKVNAILKDFWDFRNFNFGKDQERETMEDFSLYQSQFCAENAVKDLDPKDKFSIVKMKADF